MNQAPLLKRSLPFLLIGLVAIATAGAGLRLFQKKQAEAASVTAAAPPADASGTKPGAKASHIRGELKAKVTIEEFADFQCPPCATLSTLLHKLEQDYHGKLRIVFRHYPLTNHQNARPAGLAAEAAALQGKFWEMHDLLYQSQSGWSKATDVNPLLTGYAASLGLDISKFTADMRDPTSDARIKADQERATSLGVRQTPTVFINNELVPPSEFSATGLRSRIDAALAPKAKP